MSALNKNALAQEVFLADLARRCPHITDDKNKSRTQKIIANTKVNIRNQKMLLPNGDNFDYLTLTNFT